MSVVGRAERMADFYAENGEVVGRERLAGTLKISGVGQTGLFGLKEPKQIWGLRDLGTSRFWGGNSEISLRPRKADFPGG